MTDIPSYFLDMLARRGSDPLGNTAEQAARDYASMWTLDDAKDRYRGESRSVYDIAAVLRVVELTGDGHVWELTRLATETPETPDGAPSPQVRAAEAYVASLNANT